MSIIIQSIEVLLLLLIVGNQIALRGDHIALAKKLAQIESKLDNLKGD